LLTGCSGPAALLQLCNRKMLPAAPAVLCFKNERRFVFIFCKRYMGDLLTNVSIYSYTENVCVDAVPWPYWQIDPLHHLSRGYAASSITRVCCSQRPEGLGQRWKPQVQTECQLQLNLLQLCFQYFHYFCSQTLIMSTVFLS
jgi:hypothetical protein